MRPLVALHENTIGGSVNIDVIIDGLILEERAAKRKTWRPLGQFRLPTSFSVRAFGEHIIIGLVEAFRDREPVEFVSLVHMHAVGTATAYHLQTHYIELTDTINNFAERIVRETFEPAFDREEAKARHSAEVAAILSDFHISGSVDLSQRFNCLRLRCDPRTRTAWIRPFTPRSMRPQDYPGRLATTSELLEYTAALLNSSALIADLGDPYWISTYSWTKFITRFMDEHGIDLGRIQVNDTDPEEWDFVNTEFDYEIGGRTAASTAT